MKKLFTVSLTLILLALNGNLICMDYRLARPESTYNGSFVTNRNNSQEMIDYSENKDLFEFITLDQYNIGYFIAEHFNKDLHFAEVKRFADGETEVVLNDTNLWYNKHIFIIQSTHPSPQEQTLHVSFLAHELKNAGCAKVTAILPYFGYSRQEKSKIHNKSGPAYVIAQLLQGAGIDEIVTIEAHTPVLKKFFTIPFHSLSPLDLITEHIRQNIDLSHGVTLIAVDKGAYDRAHEIAQKLKSYAIYFTKDRYAQNKTKILSMSGELTTPTAIIVDDIIDTGGTALNVCDELKRQGAQHIFGYFVHPVLSNNALNKIHESNFEKVFVANTLPLDASKPVNKIEIFDISSILTKYVYNTELCQ